MSRSLGRLAVPTALLLLSGLAPTSAQAADSDPQVTSIPSPTSVPAGLAVEGGRVTAVGDAEGARTVSSSHVDLSADPPAWSQDWALPVSYDVSRVVTDGAVTAWSSKAAYESVWSWRGPDGTTYSHAADGSGYGPVSAVSGRWLLVGDGTVVDATDPSARPVLSFSNTQMALQDHVLYVPGPTLAAVDPSTVVTRDLDTGATDRIAVPGCGHVSGVQIAGSWLLAACDEGAVLVDLTGRDPARSLDGFYRLGNGYLLSYDRDADYHYTLRWSSLTDPASWRALGTLVDDPSYAPGAYAGSQGPDPTVAWYDRESTGHLARLPVPASTLPAHPTSHRSAGAPADFTATPFDGGADLSWSLPTDVGDSPVTGFVLRGDGRPQRLSADTRQHPVYNLQNGVRRTFTITAVNEQGEGLSVLAGTTPVGLPETPVHVGATAGDGSAVVRWTAPGDGGSPITGYTVKAYSDLDRTQPAVTVAGSTLTATLRGLHNGTTYSIQVSASNALGASPNPGVVNNIGPRGVPGAPTAPRITPGDRHVVVTWQPPASDGGSPITGYLVTLSSGQSARTEYVATSQRFDLLTNGKAVSATVVAISALGRSPAAATAAVVPAAVPYPMSPPRATAARRAAVVSWSRAQPKGTPVTGYQVQSSSGTLRTLSASTTRTTFSGLRSKAGMQFRVRATSRLGPSPFSSWSNRVVIK